MSLLTELGIELFFKLLKQQLKIKTFVHPLHRLSPEGVECIPHGFTLVRTTYEEASSRSTAATTNMTAKQTAGKEERVLSFNGKWVSESEARLSIHDSASRAKL